MEGIVIPVTLLPLVVVIAGVFSLVVIENALTTRRLKRSVDEWRKQFAMTAQGVGEIAVATARLAVLDERKAHVDIYGRAGKHYFRIITDDGEVLRTERPYATREAALNGAASVCRIVVPYIPLEHINQPLPAPDNKPDPDGGE